MSDRLKNTLADFDEANRQDPTLEQDEHGNQVPKELLYAQRMSDTLASFMPGASETLQLAARSQHIQRWKKPRDAYPMTRPGYPAVAYRTQAVSRRDGSHHHA